jgi:hypothetical protein
MIRLRIAVLFVAVVSGDYAALMLIDGLLIHFGVAAIICAGSSLTSGVMAYADRRRRKALTVKRAAGRGRPEGQAANGADRQCPFCGGARQTLSASSRFVGRQGAGICAECAPALTQSRHDERVAGLGASSEG